MASQDRPKQSSTTDLGSSTNRKSVTTHRTSTTVTSTSTGDHSSTGHTSLSDVRDIALNHGLARDAGNLITPKGKLS